MAVKSDGTGSAAVVVAAPGPPGPGPAPGGNPPGSPGNVRPSGLNCNLKSNSPFRSVLSMIGRPICCCSMLTMLARGTPAACMVRPVGLIIISMAPRGTTKLGSPGPPRCQGDPGGGGGGRSAAAGTGLQG